MRRSLVTLSVSILLAVISGAVWHLWLGHTEAGRCGFSRDALGTALIAIVLVGGSMAVASRLRAWQTRSSRAGVGFGILTLWLVVVALVAASLLFSAAHHCLD